MAQDPLSRVASWLTPADESLTASPPEDPVIALIAEAKRLDALWDAATTRGDEIFSTLPDDIRMGQVQVSFSGPCAALLDGGWCSEAALHRLVSSVRRLATARARAEVETVHEEAEFDREIGLDRTLAQLRAGLEEIKAIREASGCDAHYREAEDIERRAGEVGDQIRNTKPITLAGAIAMLEWVNEDDGNLINMVIAGLRDIAAGGMADLANG